MVEGGILHIGVLSLDDTLLRHDGQHFDKIAELDDHTDDPVHFQLWEPVEVDALETGLKAAGLPIRARTYALQESAPHT